MDNMLTTIDLSPTQRESLTCKNIDCLPSTNDRKVSYIDVGNMSKSEAESILEDVKKEMNSSYQRSNKGIKDKILNFIEYIDPPF